MHVSSKLKSLVDGGKPTRKLINYQMNNALVSDPGQPPQRDGGEVADARRRGDVQQALVRDVAAPAAS